MSANRRQFLSGLFTGAVALLAAPAIVRASSLMPIKPIVISDPAGMFDLTNMDRLTWFEGYEPLPFSAPNRIVIVKRMTEAGWVKNPSNRHDRDIMDAPGLDRAIERALKD